MKEYTIKNTQGEIIYSGEYESFIDCIEDAALIGENLRNANLKGANLRGANLRKANLSYADLTDANLGDIDLEDAKLCHANLRGAYLYEADLEDIDLRNADLRCADLEGARLWDTRLDNAIGIKSYGPVGQYDRIIYAVKHEECIMFKIGCFWDTYEEALKAVGEKYGESSEYYKAIEKLNLEVSKEK